MVTHARYDSHCEQSPDNTHRTHACPADGTHPRTDCMQCHYCNAILWGYHTIKEEPW